MCQKRVDKDTTNTRRFCAIETLEKRCNRYALLEIMTIPTRLIAEFSGLELFLVSILRQNIHSISKSSETHTKKYVLGNKPYSAIFLKNNCWLLR
jgi:hypothetical protein